MYQYKAPLLDMKFLLNALSSSDHTEHELILDQAAKLAEESLAPANAMGDKFGCQFNEGQVVLDSATKEAFQRYVEGGWMGICMPSEYEGQDLPEVIGSKVGEMITSANHSISMVSALTMSACKAIISFGNESLKASYLPKMISGEWTGTMCMTEPHCGSDLGLINTCAEANTNDSYQITGTKIFISAGEHDGSNNIIHLVLARIKGAPTGVKGLSLFLVPKHFPDTGNQNAVTCIGIEEKMGIHANPTCTMNFESAEGYLVGNPNEGIKAMFTMMNEMRLGTALQGVGLSENAFQASYHYASERLQGKTLDKSLANNSPADPLIQHTDVRRMLLTQKAFAESGRALCQHCAELLDQSKQNNESSKAAEKQLGLLTPIAKAFLTETGLESASFAIQVYGGHGYIRESGVEQIYRDGRIATLYEGTTGIQALDLLGRKVLGDQGHALMLFTKKMYQLCLSVEKDRNAPLDIKKMATTLQPYSKEWLQLCQQLGMKAMMDHEEVGAAASDFLMYSGYLVLAYFWLEISIASQRPELPFDNAYLNAKVKTGTFYFEKILPRAQLHKSTIESGKQSLKLHEEGDWLF